MASGAGGGIGSGAAGATTPVDPADPTFTPEDLCRQLNKWKIQVDAERAESERQHVETQKNLSVANLSSVQHLRS